MADDTRRQRESVSLTPVTHGLENMAAEFLESMEEGQLPQGNSSLSEGRDIWDKASKPISRWRSLQLTGRARSFCREHKQLFRWVLTGLLCTAYIAFLITACLLDFQRALALLVITCVVLGFLAYDLLKRLLGSRLRRCVKFQVHSRLSLWLKR
ncbi:sodium/nucleoside cotransporter 1-like [Cricetulus griseus]|uniref:Sodium/nucleoside cotransporter 1-like n=1 Tax=Cricetulus griseus TaxID=10029 RepID=A0A9J7GT59_CRIGR|nr:sodium/nucleoside cotransporter 1-like [Cricetulus griseus]XP_035317826.1 sodium/nucleoside cotransporter 1-like [Cricetulus griseus]